MSMQVRPTVRAIMQMRLGMCVPYMRQSAAGRRTGTLPWAQATAVSDPLFIGSAYFR